MAYTVTNTYTVFGNKSVRILNVTADAAEANIMLTQNGDGSVTVQISYITTK